MNAETTQDGFTTADKGVTPDKRRRGRPATITLAIVQEIARLIAKGMTEEQACLRVGINPASLRTAKHRNPEFETAIKEAQAEYLDESLDIIGQGGRGWQGRAWILERRHGEQFRRNSALELSGQLAMFNPVDALIRKPLHQWTNSDLENSVGAWKLLKKWPTDQLRELYALYKHCWGPFNDWSDEQLEWGVELEERLAQTEAENTGEPIECRATPLLLGEPNHS
jgi:hypothetical protein